MQGITRLSVNQIVLKISNPTLSACENQEASYVIIGHLVEYLRGMIEFKTGNHTLLLWEARGEIRSYHVHNSQAALEEAMSALPMLDTCQLKRVTNMWEWHNMLPSTVNGTDLVAQEWHNSLLLCYIIDPLDLHPHCDG